MSLKTTADEVLALIERGGYSVGGRYVSIADSIRNAIERSRILILNNLRGCGRENLGEQTALWKLSMERPK